MHPLSIRIILRSWNELPFSLRICLVTTIGSSLLHFLLRLSQNLRKKWHDKYKLVHTVMELLRISSMVLIKNMGRNPGCTHDCQIFILFQNMLCLYKVDVSACIHGNPSVSQYQMEDTAFPPY